MNLSNELERWLYAKKQYDNTTDSVAAQGIFKAACNHLANYLESGLNKAECTAGPWYAFDGGVDSELMFVAGGGDDDVLIAEIRCDDVSQKTAEANRQLIIESGNINYKMKMSPKELGDKYIELLKQLSNASEMCTQGYSQIAEELCHEMANQYKEMLAGHDG